jgi:hypothetical protein
MSASGTPSLGRWREPVKQVSRRGASAQVDDGDEPTDQELTVERSETEDARRNFVCRS